jgi:hypothetical protein
MRSTAVRRSTSAVGSDGYLGEVLGLLWPPPARVVTGRQRLPRHIGALLGDFTVLPNLKRPRIVLPRAPRRAAATAVDLDDVATSTRARLLTAAMKASLRTGIGQALGARVRMVDDSGIGCETIAGYLGDAIGQDVYPTFRVGPPRANRKPVLRLLDGGGGTVGFAKIGVSDLTSALVRAEAAALAEVNRIGATSFTAPAVLHHGQWHGLEVLVQSPLPIRAAPRVGGDERRVVAMLDLATGSNGLVRLAVVGSPYWGRLRTLIDEGDDEFSTALGTALDRIADGLGDTELTFGAWHGDWTPWNMSLTPDTLLLWDWERYESDVPLGFDALHFHFQKIKSTMRPTDAIRAVHTAAPELLEPFGVPAASASRITVMYAATLASRYARDFATMGAQTWKFRGSPMLGPLTRFVAEWTGAA